MGMEANVRIIFSLTNLKREIEFLAKVQNGDFANRASVMLFNLGKVADAFGVNIEELNTAQVKTQVAK